jgi:hypothetical protein
MKSDGIITQNTKISISIAEETSNLIHVTVHNFEFYEKIILELWQKSKFWIDFFQFDYITLYT